MPAAAVHAGSSILPGHVLPGRISVRVLSVRTLLPSGFALLIVQKTLFTIATPPLCVAVVALMYRAIEGPSTCCSAAAAGIVRPVGVMYALWGAAAQSVMQTWGGTAQAADATGLAVVPPALSPGVPPLLRSDPLEE